MSKLGELLGEMRRAHDNQSGWCAKSAATVLCELLHINDENMPKIGIVLGTGWGGALGWKNETRVPFGSIGGFEGLRQLEGHARQVVLGAIEGCSVIALQGRVHLNEAPGDPNIYKMVRLQIEMLLQLGVKTLILTSAVGSLRPDLKVGEIMVVDGFMSLYAPDMPLFAGEFVSPDDTLSPALREIALQSIVEAGGEPKQGGLAMVRGPFFEGRKYDKPKLMERDASMFARLRSMIATVRWMIARRNMRAWIKRGNAAIGATLKHSGISTVGMSILPEACIAALYGVDVLALNFVTNSAFELHSHDENQRRAKEKSVYMGEVLHGIIRRLNAR